VEHNPYVSLGVAVVAIDSMSLISSPRTEKYKSSWQGESTVTVTSFYLCWKVRYPSCVLSLTK